MVFTKWDPKLVGPFAAMVAKPTHAFRDGIPETPAPRHVVLCEDGYEFSVATGLSAYCVPRNNIGPYTHVEIGFPPTRPEPWEGVWEHFRNTDEVGGERAPNDIYCQVPVHIVETLIQLHGGEAKLIRRTVQALEYGS